MRKFSLAVGSNSTDKTGAAAETEALASSVMAPLTHAMTTQRLMQKDATHLVNNGALSMALAARLWDPTVWSEWAQLQAAVVRRLCSQGQDWKNGCTILLEDYGQLQHANTMSKLLEKQSNLMSQSAELVTSQTTNFVALLENIDVDYGYWVSQKLSADADQAAR